MHIAVTEKDVESLQKRLLSGSLPEAIAYAKEERTAWSKALDAMKETVRCLDTNYGADRHPEEDLGGYGIVLLTLESYRKHYQKTLEYYHIKAMEPEYKEVLADTDMLELCQQVFLVSSDYAVILLFPEKKRGE